MLRRSGFALELQVVLMQAAWIGVRLMAVYRALDLGASPLFLGVLASVFSLPALFASFWVGTVADRYGGAILAAVGVSALGLGSALLMVTGNLWWLLPLCALVGAGHMSTMIGQQTFVAHQATDSGSDGAFGNMSAAASVGQLIGAPIVTSVVALAPTANGSPNTTVGLLVPVGAAVLALPLYAAFRRADRERSSVRKTESADPDGIRTVLSIDGMWRALTVSGAVLVTSDLVLAFLPVWAEDKGVGVADVGWLLALRAVVSLFSRIGLSALVGRFGRPRLLGLSVGLGAVALAALPFVGVIGAVFVMVGLGITLGLPQPLTMAWVVGLAGPGSRGSALGLRMTANRLAQVTLPVAIGSVAAPVGVGAIFLANSVLLAGAVVVALRG